MHTPASSQPASERTVPVRLARDEPTSGGSKTHRVSVDATPLPAVLAGGGPRVRGYDILSVVGTGGMGIVYEARHRELNRRVALKTLRGEALADPEFRDRFRAEAEAIAKLQHPNVIQVFEVGTVEPVAGEVHPSPFIALEFVDGGSLAAKARSPQVPAYAARTVATLARAAHAAHQLGVIHRDLKPANVLLSRDGEPKIADFGIAKQTEPGSGPQPLTRAGIVMGTPEYMSPEQLEGDTASPSIDIYALGVILYELLTGRVPFKGAVFSDTMRLTLHQEPLPPHKLQPSVPHDLETICLKCLEKEAGKRYETAAALADDLERWLDGRPILARPLGPTGRGVRWARRNPAVAALSLLALTAAVAGLSGLLWGWYEADQRAHDAKRLMHTASENARRATANEERAKEEAAKNRAAAERERWERYRLSLMTASSALWSHDALAARRALDRAPDEYRDWVWDLLAAQLDRSQRVLGGPDERICAAAPSPSGRWMATRGAGRELTVWDLVAGRRYGPFADHRGLQGLVISDSGAVAYASPSHEIVVLDPLTGAARALRGHTKDVHELRFLSDRELISTADDRTVRVWDLGAWRETRCVRVPDDALVPLVLSPRGDVVGARWDGTKPPAFWSVRTGQKVGELPDRGYSIAGYIFSPDGTRIVSNDNYPGTAMRVWDTKTGAESVTLVGHDNQVSGTAFSPDGTRLASSSMDRTVRIWDVSPGAAGAKRDALHVLEGHSGWIQRVVFNRDGTRVLSSAQDRTLRYWNATTGRQVAVLRGHSNNVHLGWFFTGARGEALIASQASDETVRLWDARAAENDYALRGHESYVYGAQFFPDGARIASSGWDDTARIWDAHSGKELHKLEHGNMGIVSSVAVHPSGKMIATLVRRDGKQNAADGVRLWDAETGKLLHTWTTPRADYRDGRVAFSPDGKLLASGASDALVRVWDVTTRREVAVLKGHTQAVRDVAFSPDGRLIASAGCGGDGTVRVWEVATGRGVATLHNGARKDGLNAVAWHPNGKLLATGAADGSVRLWEPQTGKRVGELKHRSDVYGLAFSPNGELLATGTADNLVRLWHVDTRREVAELSGHTMYVYSVAFDRDGSRLISASGDKTVRIWDTNPQRAKMGQVEEGVR